MESQKVLKILLPTVGFTNQHNVLEEIEKAGVPFSLIMLSERRGERRGELPARNDLFRMALQDPNWDYCVTLSDDIFELPTNWGQTFVEQMQAESRIGRKVGALNAYGFVNTIIPGKWAQFYIDKDGSNTGLVQEDSGWILNTTPPNPELSTACCCIRREVLETVGLFDEGFGMGGGMEHWDYVIRMYQQGWENLLTYAVRFKADIATGNNFVPNDTYTYYHKKWGYDFDGIPVRDFVVKARNTK